MRSARPSTNLATACRERNPTFAEAPSPQAEYKCATEPACPHNSSLANAGRPVRVRVVVEARLVGPRDRGRQVGPRPGEAPSHVGFRDIMATRRDTGPDAVKCQVGRIHGHVVQFDSVAVCPRFVHVAENSGTGQGGFQQMRPARAERRPPPPQRFASCLSGAVRHAARNRVGVDDVQPTEPRGTRQCGLAAPVRAGHDMERRMARSVARPDQADFRSGREITLSPSFVRAM